MFQRWIAGRGPFPKDTKLNSKQKSASKEWSRHKEALSRLVVFCTIFLFSPTTSAYVNSRSSSTGAEVHWTSGSRLTFRTNETNSSNLSHDTVFQIFTTSLQRWKQMAFGAFDFIYYQGTDTNLYPAAVGTTTDNVIFFTSHATSQSDQLSQGVIALTVVYFDPNNGVASRAHLRFNDTYFRFTSNPADTVSQSNIYLGDVATHELGHALGLDHSENLQSTMIYTAGIEMSKPSCDDQAALVHLYAPDHVKANYGTLTGNIQSPNGAIFGAHVNAISLERGTALASSLSDKDGSFQIAGLEPGHYSLVVEPYYPGSSALNQYYSGINSNLCGGSSFERTFVQDGNKLKLFTISPGNKTDAGALNINCVAPSSLNNNSEESLNSAPTLTSSALDNPVATQSVFAGSSNDHYYMLKNQTGHLSASVLAYTLFSPVRTQVEFLDVHGKLLSQNNQSSKFSASDSGYTNFDSETSTDLAAIQDIIVHVSSVGAISNYSFPASGVGLSGTSYYALTISRGISSNPLYSTNARCEQKDNFSPYSNQGTPSSANDGGGGGCGTIYHDDGSSSHDNPFGSQSHGRIINLAALIMMLLMMHKQFKRRYT